MKLPRLSHRIGASHTFALAVVLAVTGGVAVAGDAPVARWDANGAGNPLLPGYFADPSIVRDNGRWYIFATIDPWGGDTLGLWQSDNGRDWTFSTPAWPTKSAATSPTSGDSKVWAPSVVKGANGRWYMYVSVGSEVWVGSAPSPGGPWSDANGGKPLITRDFDKRYHMIDAEAFVDEDGQAYLYWGSGLNWVNGHCFVVKLKPDMVTFDGRPRDVTPANYFEAPFMVKSGKNYLLTYSDGNTTKDTYKVRYAVGTSPMGPFREAANSPTLETDHARNIISPGHHSIFRSEGQAYILYHRQALPFPRKGKDVLRQVAVDPLTINGDGSIAKVVPTHGPPVSGFAPGRNVGLRWTAKGDARALCDDNYATLWRKPSGERATVVADLGTVRAVKGSRLRPEFATRAYDVGVEGSTDGREWKSLATSSARTGSPITIEHSAKVRYLRLVLPKGDAAFWEWSID